MIDFKRKLLQSQVVNPKAIFNADETGLFYRCMPNYIYAVNISPSDKKDLRGFKYMASKDRITLMVCANAGFFVLLGRVPK